MQENGSVYALRSAQGQYSVDAVLFGSQYREGVELPEEERGQALTILISMREVSSHGLRVLPRS